ncbi:Alpha-hydroxy acid dehydrogenase- FMN-dependent [Apiospora saccharicola]|uniref:Alpha-hydroxy acid dehydrogenase- FMN-dependent n=1 Tax=Apiospora saccharicola TaxID=335842 RepID=A0ABR1TKR5_9PEZI
MSPKINAAVVETHASPDDCWVVVNGRVYDLTKFAPEHPGGADIIYTWAGKDASGIYNEFHTPQRIESELPASEKLGDLDGSTVTETWRQRSSPQTPSPGAVAPSATTDAARASPSDEERGPPPLSALINLRDFEEAFEKHGSAKSHAYISGASNDLLTLRANERDWQRLWFRPRILRNVGSVKTETTMLGQPVSMPVWIAPMGVAKTGGPEAEAALGRGAAAVGIIHCVSTVATLTLEETLASVPDKQQPFWFQLYVNRNRTKSEEALRRLELLPQVKAVLVTVDLPVVSKREADERVRASDLGPILVGGQPVEGPKGRGAGLASSTGNFIDSTTTWEDLPWIRRCTKLPIVLKGIQSAADAKKALLAGCAGIVVSNHGGRALDNAPSSVLVLLELRRDCPEVFEKMEVYVDGGVRRGSDILKAFCLGARGVGIGRPFQCAIAYGTEGVEHCARILKDELETAMRLCGVTDLAQVRGDMSWLNTSELDRMLPPKEDIYPPLRPAWGRLWSKL